MEDSGFSSIQVPANRLNTHANTWEKQRFWIEVALMMNNGVGWDIDSRIVRDDGNDKPLLLEVTASYPQVIRMNKQGKKVEELRVELQFLVDAESKKAGHIVNATIDGLKTAARRTYTVPA